MREFVGFVYQIYEKRYLLQQMVKRDLKQKYVESYLGLVWAILEPLTTTAILSMIFIFGFKAGVVQELPFFLYMFSGMVAFNYFSMAANEGSSVIRNYSFLVKKVNFRLSILPIVKIISCSVFHLIMLALLFVVLFAYGYYPSFYWLQVLYYFVAMNVMILGVTWLTSSLAVFIPDLKHVIGIGIQFLFYLSPIFWGEGNIPQKWHFMLKINPMYYIIQGYRDSLIYHKGFWHYPGQTLYFWGLSLVILVTGVFVFKRLRPHFADVL